MRVLLHICCAPCSIYPIDRLRGHGHDIMGFFQNSNIHPYTEYLKRLEGVIVYSRQIGMEMIVPDRYDLEEFLRGAVFRESERCRFCYHDRLRATALTAAKGRFDAFSSTLLYSKFQKHDLIASVGEAVGREVGIPFLYEDFRTGWKKGIAISKQLGMYRQQYCGCIYSEKDRYYRPSNRNRNA